MFHIWQPVMRTEHLEAQASISKARKQGHTMKILPDIAQQLRQIADQLEHGVSEIELDAIISELDKIGVLLVLEQ